MAPADRNLRWADLPHALIFAVYECLTEQGEGVSPRSLAASRAVCKSWAAISLEAITSLQLQDCSRLPEGWSAVFPRLTSLNLGSSYITDSQLESLDSMAELKSLNLAWCHPVSDSGLILVSKIKSLTSLNIKGCKKITSAGVASLSELPGLTELNMEGCERVRNTGIQAISKLTALRSLTMGWCYQVSDIGFLATLTGLKYLDLSQCWKVSCRESSFCAAFLTTTMPIKIRTRSQLKLC